MEVRKQLSFDLDTTVLKEIFGEENYTRAYSDIQSFMKKNDCKHIEGSVYMSNQSMSNLEVLNLLADLKEQYPYIIKCVREMHQANISDIHSLSAEFEYDGTPGEFAEK
jgi:virulence-associated protein VapD